MFTIERWSLRIVARYEIIIGALGSRCDHRLVAGAAENAAPTWPLGTSGLQEEMLPEIQR